MAAVWCVVVCRIVGPDSLVNNLKEHNQTPATAERRLRIIRQVFKATWLLAFHF